MNTPTMTPGPVRLTHDGVALEKDISVFPLKRRGEHFETYRPVKTDDTRLFERSMETGVITERP